MKIKKNLFEQVSDLVFEKDKNFEKLITVYGRLQRYYSKILKSNPRLIYDSKLIELSRLITETGMLLFDFILEKNIGKREKAYKVFKANLEIVAKGFTYSFII